MAAPVFQAAGSALSSTGAVTPVWPTHVAGDVAICFVESANEAISLSTPSGFVEVTGSPQGTGTAAGLASTRLAAFWCRATTSPMANPVVADSGDHTIAQIITFRGCIASGNPWDVTAGDVLAAASTAVSIPGATTSVAECLIVAAIAQATDSATGQITAAGFANASLASITQRSNVGTISGNGGGFAVATGVKTAAGAYSATTATLTTSSVQGRLSIALKPATANVTVNPGLAAVIYTGFAAIAKLAINAFAGTAAVVYTGLAPTAAVSNHQVVTPGVSGVVYTGHSPAVVIGAATVVQPGTAAISYTGLAPTLLVTVKIPVGLGSVVYTGLAPTVAISNNKFPSPGLGQVVYTGFAPSVVAAITAKPGTGSVTYGGFAPVVVLSNNQIVTANLGQITYTGFAPSALIGTAPATIASPGRAQIIYTGFAPIVIQPLRPAIARSSATTPIRRASSQTTPVRAHAGTTITDTYTWASNTFTFADTSHNFSQHRGMA